MDNPFVITSVRSMRPYARKVVECLRKETEFADVKDDIDYTNALTAQRFADGEMEVSLDKPVRCGAFLQLLAERCGNQP